MRRFKGMMILMLLLFIPTLVFGIGIRATWNANTETDLAGYKVYYGIATGVYGAPIDVGKVTTYDIGNLSESTKYFIAITAYDTSGNESLKSLEASITIPDVTPPAVPAAPSLTPGAKSMGVSWTAVATAATYKVYFGTATGVYGTPVTVSGTSTTLTNLLDNTTYFVAISAIDASGNESAKSAEISGKTRDTVPPAVPAAPTLTPGAKQITVSWTAVPEAASYKVYFGTATGVYGTPVTVTGATSYTLTNLMDNTTYYVAISSVDVAANESAKSTEISSKTKDTTPPAPPSKPTLSIWDQIAAFFKRFFRIA
jgi:fibronectin type 3 domain-containing protein